MQAHKTGWQSCHWHFCCHFPRPRRAFLAISKATSILTGCVAGTYEKLLHELSSWGWRRHIEHEDSKILPDINPLSVKTCRIIFPCKVGIERKIIQKWMGGSLLKTHWWTHLWVDSLWAFTQLGGSGIKELKQNHSLHVHGQGTGTPLCTGISSQTDSSAEQSSLFCEKRWSNHHQTSVRKKLVKLAGLLFYSHTHRSYSTYHVLRNTHSLTTSELLPKLTARLPSNYCIVNKKLLPTVFLITRKNTRTGNRNTIVRLIHPEKLLPAFKEIDSCIH